MNQSGEEKLRASREVSQILCSMGLECTTILACRQSFVQLSHVSQYIVCSTQPLWVSVETVHRCDQSKDQHAKMQLGTRDLMLTIFLPFLPLRHRAGPSGRRPELQSEGRSRT